MKKTSKRNSKDSAHTKSNEKVSNSSPNTKDIHFDIDKFLHEPIRLQIMAQLYALEQTDMIFLKNTLEVTWGALSFHCTQLEEKGYVIIEKQFIGKKPYTLLKITPEGKSKFEEYKTAMFSFLK